MSASERFSKRLSLEVASEVWVRSLYNVWKRSQAFGNFRGSLKYMGLWKNNLASNSKIGKKYVFCVFLRYDK